LHGDQNLSKKTTESHSWHLVNAPFMMHQCSYKPCFWFTS